MKRDMGLVRKLLLKIEEQEVPGPSISIDGHSQDQVNFHLMLMEEGGLIVGTDTTSNGSTYKELILVRLTWRGCEFLDLIRDDGTWQKLIKSTGEGAKGLSLEVIHRTLSETLPKIIGPAFMALSNIP